MMRHAPEITHLVQALAVVCDVRDAAALSSHAPKLMSRQLVHNTAFPRSETPQQQRSHNHHHLTRLSSTKAAGASTVLLTVFRIND